MANKIGEGFLESVVLSVQIILFFVALASVSLVAFLYNLISEADPVTREQRRNLNIAREIMRRAKTASIISLPIFVVSCVGGNFYEKNIKANSERSESGKYEAMAVCKKALKPELDAADSLERSVAVSLFGSDAGSSAIETSPGSFAVDVVRGISSDASCPIRLDGSCTVANGVATVTKPLTQNGYIGC